MRTAHLAAALLSSSIALTATIALAQDRPIVAVFRIEDKAHAADKATLDQLTDYLGAAIAEGGVFRRVPPGDLVKALMAQTTESYKECYDQSCQIEIGREVAATKSLSTRILKLGSTCTVTAELYDLKTKATDVTAKESGPCGVDGLMASLDKVAATLRAYGSTGKASGFKEGKLGGKTETWDVGSGEEVVVAFSARPEAALVMVDGKLLCQKTPCSKSLPSGAHQVSMQSERYQERSERVVVVKGARLDWELRPAFGWLTVRSAPAGLPVSINGQASGNTPLEKKELAPGGYEVLVGGPCHAEAGERVKVELGQVREVAVSPAAREAGLEVKARDGAGNDLEADVLVDGQKVGVTPGRFKVSVCAKEVELRHAKVGSVKKALSLVEKQVSKVEVELKAIPDGMVLIPAGEFMMGCSQGDGECLLNEKPQHRVWVSEFLLDATEVTVAAYARCVEVGRCNVPRAVGARTWGAVGKEQHPVNCVDWSQAKGYCEWAGKRLPTEAEWEKAARGGAPGARYDDLEAIAWYEGNSGGATHPVGKKQPNAFGLYDMLGNVWEWCADRYEEGYYKDSPNRDPVGPSIGEDRILRGGSFDNGTWGERASFRFKYHSSDGLGSLGFRCAGSASPGEEMLAVEPKAGVRAAGLQGGSHALDWIFSRPAGIEFTKTEVTVAQYKACVEAGKCSAVDAGDSTKYCNWDQVGLEAHPVTCVDWNQAVAFCEWAGGRLPTEQEWYAEASDGGKRRYPWGDQEVSCDRAIWEQGGEGCGKDATWPVCSKLAGNSVSELCDMSGNVWEWTSSSEGSNRVLHGGSGSSADPGDLLASARTGSDPTSRYNRDGFRCARSAKP
ncbi:MAG TPA: SUMF1/EgtB/PvdO family nonheme iron enzyme [Myxococcota bacterium]|nr:SUMF1/EgtB/PvdO family nonheme iron enzyme [Myxococcota bacterium]HRY92245.1 SUMF1/EgtB/PvdO family nonheme iron enzyme [Myxococcota bacterium]